MSLFILDFDDQNTLSEANVISLDKLIRKEECQEFLFQMQPAWLRTFSSRSTVLKLHLTSYRWRKSQDIKLRRQKDGWEKAMILLDCSHLTDTMESEEIGISFNVLDL